MKVAVVRGPSLNAWEMQTYEPLVSEVQLTAVGSYFGHYDISPISFPVKKLFCTGSFLGLVPGGISWAYGNLGDPQKLMLFDRFIEGFDIVQAAELASFYSLQAVQAKKRGLVKAVTLTIYENVLEKGGETRARKRLREEVVKGADYFIPASSGAKAVLLEEGVRPEQVSVVAQGIDARRFVPRKSKTQSPNFKVLKEKYGLREDDFVVLSAGRMVEEKGWEDIVRCADKIKSSEFKIKNRERKIKFLFVGGGPEKRSLQKQIGKLGLEGMVVFAGELEYSEMPRVYGLADVFVLASRLSRVWKEQFGYVLLEAMASGLPIVATDTGAIPEVVGSKAGLIVPPKDPEELGRAITKVLNDRELAGALGKAGRERVLEKFDAKVVSKEIYKIWQQVLTERK